jgi:hypothetical protein
MKAFRSAKGFSAGIIAGLGLWGAIAFGQGIPVPTTPQSLQAGGTNYSNKDPTSFYAGAGISTNVPSSNGFNLVQGGGAGAALVSTIGSTSLVLLGHNAGGLYTGTSGGNHALVAIGDNTGGSVTTGPDDVYVGADAGFNVHGTGTFITGPDNVGIGTHSNANGGSGGQNVATGANSMTGCGAFNAPSCPALTGSSNTADGDSALSYIQGGAFSNTATGASACLGITTGSENTCNGAFTGSEISTGQNNYEAGYNQNSLNGAANNQVNIAGVFEYLGSTGQFEVDLKNNATGGYIGKIIGGSVSYGILQGSGGSDFQIINSSGGYIVMNDNMTVISNSHTVSSLPAGVVGAMSYVTDQLTVCPAAGATLTGGGTVTCAAFYNGTAWVGL